MSESFSDEDEDNAPVFAFRADNIMQKQREAYEAMLKKVEEEDTVTSIKDEESELLLKIQEKLKKKTKSRKKASAKARPSKAEEKSVPAKRQSRRRKNPIDDDVNEDNMSKEEDQTQINLPAHVKQKLKKIDLENTRERKRVEELNKRILSKCVSSSVEDHNTSIDMKTEQNITLKISYFSDISKITVCENEKFSSIISKVADLFNLKVTEVTLFLRDEIVSLDDTPHSLNVKAWDTIDCIPCKSTGEMTEDSDSNKILIKMQSNDSRKRIDIYAHKLEKFQDIMERYADLRDLPLKDLIFEFDGEKISGTDTPDELDMESGICVDVKVVGASLKPAPPSVPLVDLDREEPQTQMLDICVLD